MIDKNKKIEITVEQLSQAAADVMNKERIKELMQKAPVLALAFTVFSAELAGILFKGKEETK